MGIYLLKEILIQIEEFIFSFEHRWNWRKFLLHGRKCSQQQQKGQCCWSPQRDALAGPSRVSTIQDFKRRELFDYMGNPVVDEVHELRDEGRIYSGKEVSQAVNSVNTELKESITRKWIDFCWKLMEWQTRSELERMQFWESHRRQLMQERKQRASIGKGTLQICQGIRRVIK